MPPAIAAVELRFEDLDDGGVAVIDATDGRTLDVLEPGSNGFVRGAMRSLVRERRASNVGAEAPFSLLRTANGQLLLHDPTTDRRIDLRAFGATNADAFGRFLELATPTAQAIPNPPDSTDATAVALSTKESRQ